MSLLIIFGGAKRDISTLLNLLDRENNERGKVRMIFVDQARNLVRDKKLIRELETLNIETFAVEDDLEAQVRCESMEAEASFIDYVGWVKLLEESERVLCWV